MLRNQHPKGLLNDHEEVRFLKQIAKHSEHSRTLVISQKNKQFGERFIDGLP